MASDEQETVENELLAERLARAGALGGSIGGAAGAGAGGMFGGRRGGARGARWASERMPYNVRELELSLPVDADTALERATRVLSEQGEPFDPPYASPGVPTVAAVTGSMWQSPAVVTVEIATSSPNESLVKIRAVAKKSPIMRHTGDKAAERLREALASQK